MRSIRNAREGEGRGRGKTIFLAVVLGVLIFSVFYFLFSKPATSPELVAGKIGVLDQPSPPETAPAEPEKPAAPTASAPAAPAKEAQKEDFTFFKTLKGKEGQVPLQVEKPAKPPAEPAAPAVRPATEVPKVEKAPSVPKVQKVQKVEKHEKVEKVGNAKTGEKRYTIQVAALGIEGPARELAERLKRRGFHSYVVAASRPEVGTIYRVRVGSFSSLAEAKAVAERIREKENIKFFITLAEG